MAKRLRIGVLVIFLLLAAFAVIGLCIHLLTPSSLENPPKPQIVQGRFPFTLTYEVAGKRKVIRDALICQYDGIDCNEGKGKFRKWKAELENGDKTITLWKGQNAKGIKQEIYYNYAPPGYYMGDPYYKDANKVNYSDIVLKSDYKDSITEAFISEKKLLKKYNIRIINWDCERPVKNQFN